MNAKAVEQGESATAGTFGIDHQTGFAPGMVDLKKILGARIHTHRAPFPQQKGVHGVPRVVVGVDDVNDGRFVARIVARGRERRSSVIV